MSRNSQKPTVTISKFPGLQTTNDPFEVSYSGLMKAENVDITRGQKVKRRPGMTRLLTIPGIRAAWADHPYMLITVADKLIQITPDMEQVTLRTGMTPTNQLHARHIRGDVYYSNGIDTGIVHEGAHRPLGIQPPNRPTVTQAPFGAMAAGLYQVVYTYVTSYGLESGAPVAAVFELDTADRGLQITYTASTEPAVTAINIYISHPNGTELYLAKTVPNASATALHTEGPDFLKQHLRTQFKTPPPGFTGVEIYDGRMYYIVGNDVIASDPFAPEHITTGEAYLPFNKPVQTVAAGPDTGLFVGTTNATYHLKGGNLEQLELDTAAFYGTVAGSVAHMDSALLGEGDSSGILPVWMSRKGLCVGMPDGVVFNVTQKSVVIPEGAVGTTMFRQKDGQNHIISVIQK